MKIGKSFKQLKQKLANILPDEIYLKILYRRTTGKKLNLRNPLTFNEKIQWLKLNDRKHEYTVMVDKYAAKQYVADKIGEEHIIPTLGVWDRFDQIDFDALPNQFVLKCTHDSGGLVVCRNKDSLDKDSARFKIERSMKSNYYYHGREWPYKDVKPRIIAEKYMQDSSEANDSTSNDAAAAGLTDYKFYCFNGSPKFLYVSSGLENHSTASISFLTLDWQFAPYERTDYKRLSQLPPKPKSFDQMIEIAQVLSSGLDFLRVDLYEIDEEVYFSELTFSPCSGMMPFKDPIHDLEIGNMLELTRKEKQHGKTSV